MELLTEKCKEEFEKWLVEIHYEGRHDTWLHWVACTKSMKYSVLVDFFASKGIDCDDKEFKHNEALISGCDDWKGFAMLFHTTHPGRRVIKKALEEARKQAIEKANELFNESKQ